MKITDIKAALATLLANAADAGGRVFVDRERPYADGDLPCIDIAFTGADPDRTLDQYQDWNAHFSVAAVVKDAESNRPDTAAETLLGEVLALLYTDMDLDGLLSKQLSFDSIRIDKDAGGDRVLRKAILDLTCPYNEPLGVVVTDDLLLLDLQIDMSGPRNDPQLPAEPDGQIDAAATITLPQ